MSCPSLASKATTLIVAAALPIAAAGAAGRSSTLSIIEQNYPAESLARGEQGVVSFSVDLDAAANIDSCVVTKSSGYQLLDEATCGVIVAHAAFSPAESDGTRVATTRTGQMTWKLPSAYQKNAARAAPPVFQTAEQLEAQRLICSKSDAVGSKIKKVVYCLTRADWASGRAYQQTEAAKMIGYHQNHGCHMALQTRC